MMRNVLLRCTGLATIIAGVFFWLPGSVIAETVPSGTPLATIDLATDAGVDRVKGQ